MATGRPGFSGRRARRTPVPPNPVQRRLIICTAQAQAVSWVDAGLGADQATTVVIDDLRARLRHLPSLWPPLLDSLEVRFRDSGATYPQTQLVLISTDTYLLALTTFTVVAGFCLDQLADSAEVSGLAAPSTARSTTLAQALRRRPPASDPGTER